jgi:hypothetical protein
MVRRRGRRLDGCTGAHIPGEPITLAGHRDDEGRTIGIPKHFAQNEDRLGQVSFFDEGIWPHGFHQLLLRHGFSGVLQKYQQHVSIAGSRISCPRAGGCAATGPGGMGRIPEAFSSFI